MKDNNETNEVYRIRGRVEIANYKPQVLKQYSENPLIEALPAIWEWEGDEPPVVDELTQYFSPEESIRGAASSVRLHTLGLFKLQFFQVLNRVRSLEQSLSILIRSTYLGRNPRDPRHRRNLHDRVEKVNTDRRTRMVTVGNLGFSLLGAPGLGKTRSIERIIQLYPQVILHENYPSNPTFRHTQTVWLYLTCTHIRSARGLCLAFFQEVDAILGTNHYGPHSGDNADSLLAGMANVAATISLGVLFIDEIQFLDGGNDDILKFLVQLENTLRIAVVIVGTCRAANLVAGSPHLARRSSGTGGSVWLPFNLEDMEWTIFLETMWEHQYLKKYVPLNPALVKTIHEETMGIPSYAVDLHFAAQCDAINDRTETITCESLRAAARVHQIFSRPYVHAAGSSSSRQKFARILRDIYPPDFEDSADFWREELKLPPDRSKPLDVSLSESPPSAEMPTSAVPGATIPSFQPPGPGSSVAGVTRKPRRRGKTDKTVYAAGTLMAICALACQKDGTAPYEALKMEGLIRNACEFLEIASAA